MKFGPFLLSALLIFASNAAHCGEPSAQVSGGTYRISGGEKIKLIVPKEVGDSIEQLISEDGWISLPTGGASVNIKGKTIPEAQTIIGEMLEKQSGAKRVFAAVALLEIPDRKVFVGGEVKLPQAIVIPRGTSVTLAGALASAGGGTPDADLTRVMLTQRGPDGVQKTIMYDASRLNQTDNLDLGPQLETGAVVTVPRGEVYLLAGEVIKPGPYTRRELSLEANEPATVTRVLFAGGGLKPTANRRDIRIIRSHKDGSREIARYDLDTAVQQNDKSKDSIPDVALKNGDIVLVGSAGGVAILGRVKQPGLYPLGGETLKLSRLIAMAGGFVEFARSSSVIVIHANAPKSPITVDVNSIAKSNLEKDIDLEDGDLVFVGEKML